MEGITTAVSNFLDYNPPRVYEFSSCSEFAAASSEYMSNKFSTVGYGLGLGVAGLFFVDSDTYTAKNAAKSLLFGAFITGSLEIPNYYTKSLSERFSKTNCEETAAKFNNFQEFAEAVKSIYLAQGHKNA